MAFGDDLKETYDPKTEGPESDNPQFHYYYNHKERISNAPKIVQDYYNGTGLKVTKGLFKVLVSTKQNRIIFLMMVFCLAIVLILSTFHGRGNIGVLEGYEAELSSFVYDQKLYTSVKVHPVKKTRNSIESIKKKELKNVPDNKINQKLEELKSSMGKNVSVTFEGVYDADVTQKIPGEVNGVVFDTTEFFRTNSTECDIIKVRALVKIGKEEMVLVSTVANKE